MTSNPINPINERGSIMSNYPSAINTEAREMALQLRYGNRSEVREFVMQHETPTKLVLAIVRFLGSDTYDQFGGFGAYLDAVVSLQSLLESVDV